VTDSSIQDRRLTIWGGILLASILFLPPFTLRADLPSFLAVDITLPITALLVFINRKRIPIHAFYAVIIFFAAYVPITMAINGRLGAVSDYFEMYKIGKYGILIAFFSLIDYTTFSRTWFKPLFLIISITNILHYYNIFGFHDFLVSVFNNDHLTNFGLDSLGQPTTKRMMGMASNPNINAIVFGFFALHFLPLKFDKSKFIWFIAACFMILLCQSRTAIVAFGGIFFTLAVLRLMNWNWKQWLLTIVTLTGMYFLVWDLSTDFFTHTSYSNNIVSGSTTSRLSTWRYLFSMIQEKPFFGYGVNKAFFYKNELYSENEYILMTWRYGIIGLIIYLTMMILPLWHFFKKRSSGDEYGRAMLFIIFIMTIALMNNPFQDRTGMFLMALTIGLTWPFKQLPKPFSHER